MYNFNHSCGTCRCNARFDVVCAVLCFRSFLTTSPRLPAGRPVFCPSASRYSNTEEDNHEIPCPPKRKGFPCPFAPLFFGVSPSFPGFTACPGTYSAHPPTQIAYLDSIGGTTIYPAVRRSCGCACSLIPILSRGEASAARRNRPTLGFSAAQDWMRVLVQG